MRLFLIMLSLTGFISACGGGGGGGSSANAPSPSQQTGTNPSDPSSSTQGNPSGQLQIEVAATARGDVVTSQGTTQNILVQVTTDGSVTPTPVGSLIIGGTGLRLAATDSSDSTADEILCVLPASAHKTLIQARLRATQAPRFASGASQLALLDDQGHLQAFTPAPGSGITTLGLGAGSCSETLQVTGDGNIFALGTGGLGIWQLDPATMIATLVVQASSGQNILAFVASNGGHLFYSTLSGGTTTTSWRKPNGMVSDLGYPSHFINSPRSLGAWAFSFLSNPLLGVELLKASTLSLAYRSFLEPIYLNIQNSSPQTTWAKASPLRIGDWILNHMAALKPDDGLVASNPFWRAYGRFQGLVDLAEQVYFDGSNLVTLSYDNQNGLKVLAKKSILQDAALSLKVIAVFGQAQGFTQKWIGFATDDGLISNPPVYPNLYYVEIDKSTGIVDSSRVYRFVAPNMPSYWNTGSNPNFYRIPEFTPYLIPTNAGTKLIGLGGTLGAGVFDLTFDNTAKTITLGAGKGGPHTYNHGRALIAAHRLYFTPSYYDGTPDTGQVLQRAFYYDADADHVAAASEAPLAAGLSSANSSSLCNGTLSYGLIQRPAQSGPSYLYCDTSYKVRLATYSDFTFTGSPTVAALPINTPQTNDNEGDFTSGSLDSPDQMLSFAISNGVVAFGLGRPGEVRVVNADTGSSLTNVSFNRLFTERRVEFSRFFISSASPYANPTSIPTLGRWSNSKLFASGRLVTGVNTQGGYVSLLIDLDAQTSSRLSDLDDYQITTMVRLDAEHVLASGFDKTDTTAPVTFILNNNGQKISSGSSNFIVREAAGFVP